MTLACCRFWLRERAQGLGTKPECGLESMVSQIALLSRIDGARAKEMRRPAAASREGIGWRIHGGVCHVCVQWLLLVAAHTHRETGCPASHTSQKARCMRHPRLVLAARARPTV